MNKTKIESHVRKALKEIATITDKDVREDERGKFILNASGDAENIIEFLSKDRKLGPSFRKFVKRWGMEYGRDNDDDDDEAIMSAVYVKPLPNNKYLVTIHFMTEDGDFGTLNDSADYQFFVFLKVFILDCVTLFRV